MKIVKCSKPIDAVKAEEEAMQLKTGAKAQGYYVEDQRYECIRFPTGQEDWFRLDD